MQSTTPYAKQVRRNIAGHVIDGALFAWGFSTFASIEVILPMLVAGLGGTGFHIGMIPFVARTGFLVPQLFSAPYIERVRRKGRIVLIVGTLMRLPLLALAILLYWSHVKGQLPSPWVVLGLIGLMMTIGGALAPAWLDFLADTIPLRYRGRQFAIRICIGGLLGVLSGPFLVSPILKHFPFPLHSAICIGICFVLLTVGLMGLFLPKELTPHRSRHHKSLKHYWGNHLLNILKSNRNFRAFLVVKALLMGAMGLSMSFFVRYGFLRFNLEETWIGNFASVLMAGTMLGPFALGQIADHYGHRLNLIVAGFVLFGINLWALVAPTPWLYSIVFFFLSVSRSAELISFMGMSIEFSSAEERPTFIALSNTIMFPVLLIGALGGVLYDVVGPQCVFLMSAVMSVGASFCAWRFLVEPRTAPFAKPEVPPER